MIDGAADEEADSARQGARQHADEAHENDYRQILQFEKHQGAD